MPFYVSDGRRLTKSYLEVNASEPFLRVKTNTGIVVDQGGLIPISPQNLTVDTNLNIGPSGITFDLIRSEEEEARGGEIIVMSSNNQLKRSFFSQSQINSGRVLYSERRGGEPRRETLLFKAQVSITQIW